jgi:hypothetical protein
VYDVLRGHIDMAMFVSVYLPVKGWSMVVYGREGPEYTGMGQPTLVAALRDAINESNDTGYPLDVHGLVECPVCNGIAMHAEICDCGYMSQAYIDRTAEWKRLMAKLDARL